MDELRNNRLVGLRRMYHLFLVYIFMRLCLLMVRVMKDKIKKIERELKAERDHQRDKVLYRLVHSGQCRNIVRMDARSFLNLCFVLEERCGLKPTRQVGIQEMVARFLYTISHNEKHRPTAFFFDRGRATISRDFHKVINAIIELEQEYLKQPDGSMVPREIFLNDKFFPYFKDCVGAIDCTHVRAKVQSQKVTRYRGRKENPTMNVLAACTFDLKFSYVLVGWEGTASDSKIIKNALSRRYPLKIPEGKFYLVDAGFMLKSTLITPYRGERYHLKEYSPTNPPRTDRELFNLRHASLRNVIERCFGVVKKRFPVIRSATEPHYFTTTLKKIIVACCILHNYLVDKDPNLPSMLAEVDAEMQYRRPRRPNQPANRAEEEDMKRGEAMRNEMAVNMWRNYAR
ncbi:nuclease [Rhynchospora pubera]|uniref:Nuclease n=1 Tax=Rhynchospora pubera TaxID=906938 RepID=A0AAV8HS56_9POAL|nr:nuclease [Rhynchospora pubera]